MHNVHNVHSDPNRIELQIVIPLPGRPHRLKSLCARTLSKNGHCRAYRFAVFPPGTDCLPRLYCGRELACEFSEPLPERGLSAIHGDRALFACASQAYDVRAPRGVIGDRHGSRANPCGAWSELDTDFAA